MWWTFIYISVLCLQAILSEQIQTPAPENVPTARVRFRDEFGRVFKSTRASSNTKFSADVTMGDKNMTLKLDKNEDQNFRIPLFILTADKNGTLHLVKKETTTNVTLYQSNDKNAIFGFTDKFTADGTVSSMEGLILEGNNIYELTSTHSSSDDVMKDSEVERDDQQEGKGHKKEERDDAETFRIKTRVFNKERSTDTGYVTPPLEWRLGASRLNYTKRRRYGRYKRQITQDVYIDVLAIVDYEIYSTWYGRSEGSTASEREQNALERIFQYYAFVFNGVNMMYRSITSLPYTIHLTLTSIIVATSSGASPWTENNRQHESGHPRDLVVADTALQNLTDWVANGASLPPHDHLSLFTGLDLLREDGSKSVAGLAWVGTLCRTDGYASSINEDLGGYQCIWTVTHEIGHSISAKHDGDSNTCRNDDNYIMATGSQTVTDANKLNNWMFSSCSISYFDTYMSRLEDTMPGQECLYIPHTVGSEIPDVTSQMPGQQYDIDEQCQLIQGPQSEFCRTVDIGDDNNVCTGMYCQDTNNTTICRGRIAAEGTTCGDQKWCIQGVCTYDPSAPAVPDGCPFGDTRTIVFEGMNCAELIAYYGPYCHQSGVRKSCCSTCASIYLSYPVGCEYGDPFFGCTPAHCSVPDLRPKCCRTCNYTDPNITTSTTAITTTTTTTTTATTATITITLPVTTTTIATTSPSIPSTTTATITTTTATTTSSPNTTRTPTSTTQTTSTIPTTTSTISPTQSTAPSSTTTPATPTTPSSSTSPAAASLSSTSSPPSSTSTSSTSLGSSCGNDTECGKHAECVQSVCVCQWNYFNSSQRDCSVAADEGNFPFSTIVFIVAVLAGLVVVVIVSSLLARALCQRGRRRREVNNLRPDVRQPRYDVPVAWVNKV